MIHDENGYTEPTECQSCEAVAPLRFCGGGWYQCELCGARTWAGTVDL